MKSKEVVLARMFDGLPVEADFKVKEVDLPALNDGGVLVENLYLSVDPYMRAYRQRLQVGQALIGQGVARVIESKNENYRVGSLVLAQVGWRTHAVVTDTSSTLLKLPDNHPEVSPSLYIGGLGMPGLTAYFGLLNICQPKPGETVYVNSAAGAVGSVVGQLAKIKGCRVVGSAGTDEKIAWLKELGFDEVFNYKTAGPLSKVLPKYCPKGIDIFFENVGGPGYYDVLQLMNHYGRVAVCGGISAYNATAFQANERSVHGFMVGKELKIHGFLVTTYRDQFATAREDLIKWHKEGKLQIRENILDGIAKMPEAFIKMLSGAGYGKFLVKV